MDQLATVADLERLTGRSVGDDHERAEVLLDGASALVRAYCGWALSRVEERVIWLDGTGGRYLSLPCLYVTAVSSVAVIGTDVEDHSWSQNGLLYRGAYWPAGLRTVRVEYTGGYAEVPAQVKAAVAAIALRGLSTDPLGGPVIVQESVGPLSWQYAPPGSTAAELTTPEAFALAPYRIEPSAAVTG